MVQTLSPRLTGKLRVFLSHDHEHTRSQECSAKEAVLRLVCEYPFAARGRLLQAGDGTLYFWIYRDCTDCAAGDDAMTAALEERMQPPRASSGRLLPIGKFEIPVNRSAADQTGSE